MTHGRIPGELRAMATLSFRVDPDTAAAVRGAALATGFYRDEIGRLGIALALKLLRDTHNEGRAFQPAGALTPGRRPKKR